MDHLPLDELPELPGEETQEVEYKSARGVAEGQKNAWEKARAELQKAASGFWNSGGGTIWFGLGDHGELEEWRFPLKKGKQSIRDWVSRALLDGVEPVGDHQVEIFAEEEKATHGVVGVRFGPSDTPPHMHQADKKYYLRTAAHTEPASHYLVEALFTKRGGSSPDLVHTCETQSADPDAFDVILLLTGPVPAFDVHVGLDDLPTGWQPEESRRRFGAVTLEYPARIAGFKRMAIDNAKQPQIHVSYRDRSGKIYSYDAPLTPPPKRVPPPRRKVDVVRYTV